MGMDKNGTPIQQRVLQKVRDSGLGGVSGYDVYTQLDLSPGYTYKVLRQFEEAGAMERLPALVGTTIGNRVPAQPYKLTEAGRAMLEAWLSRR